MDTKTALGTTIVDQLLKRGCTYDDIEDYFSNDNHVFALAREITFAGERRRARTARETRKRQQVEERANAKAKAASEKKKTVAEAKAKATSERKKATAKPRAKAVVVKPVVKQHPLQNVPVYEPKRVRVVDAVEPQTAAVLARLGFNTLGDIVKFDEQEFSNVAGLGGEHFLEVKRAVESRNGIDFQSPAI